MHTPDMSAGQDARIATLLTTFKTLADKEIDMTKVITRDQAAQLVSDGDTVAFSSFGLSCLAEEVLIGVQERFAAEQRPRNLTVVHAAGLGKRGDDTKGLNHWCAESLIKRYVGGIPTASSKLVELINGDKIEAWCYPQGVISQLYREIAAKRPGIITRIGLGTFMDPRLEGGRMNSVSHDDLIEVVTIRGEEYLLYPSMPIDVGVIRGTYADEHGNLTMTEESLKMEVLPIAQAAKNSGGIVIAQVKQVVKAGSLDPNLVKVPGILVDYLVVSEPENHMQTENTQYNPSFSGQIKVPVESASQPLDLSIRKVIARRAACELTSGAVINLGIGIPVEIGGITSEEGVSSQVIMTTEAGSIGGVPAGTKDFGHSYNVEAAVDMSAQFDFYDGGGLDLACLGMAETDRFGNVNVSKFGGRANGPGGFIDIAQTAKTLVFAGTFTSGGLRCDVSKGYLEILQEGRADKFVKNVEQVTYAGGMAQRFNQRVLFVTERAVLELINGRLTVTEIAPGVDLDRDVLGHMAFTPKVSSCLKVMDEALFHETWGGLRESLAKNSQKKHTAEAK